MHSPSYFYGTNSNAMIINAVASIVNNSTGIAPANTVLPAISGTARADQTLSASNGTWANSPTSYTYQWQKNGVNISGATASTYLILFSDYGSVIRVGVTATNAFGSTTAYSTATAAVQWPVPVQLGTIFSEDFNGTLADYTVVGTGITIGSGSVTMTGNPTLFSSALTYTKSTSPHKVTCLEKWTQRVQCTTPATLGSTVYGIGIGIRSINSFDPFSSIVRWAWDNASGAVYLYTKDTITGQMVAGTSFTPVASTTYILEITRNVHQFTFRILNTSNTQLYTTTFSINITTANVAQAHNTGNFAIYNFGGTTVIDSWEVSSTVQRFAEALGKGDSNMYGIYPGVSANRYTEAAFVADSYTYEISAGISDRTDEVTANINEILYLKPRRVYMNIGRNDIDAGASAATVNSNIAAIKSTLQAADITVVTGRPVASNVDVSGITGDIDFYTLTKDAGNFTLNSTYNIGDGIHLNASGHAACKTLLQSSF